MARPALACLLLLTASSAREQTRWSRQISAFNSDLNDWIPLPGPVERVSPLKRQIAEPRILAEPVFPGFSRPTGFSQDFPGRTYFNSPMNRQLYLQSIPAVPSAPQNYLTDQGFRFGLSQPNFPLNQGFIGQFPFESVQPIKAPRPPMINQVAFPKSNLPSPQAKPFLNQFQKKPETKPIDTYQMENISFPAPKKPVSLQKLKYDTEKVPKTVMVPPKAKSEREEVQLLYVPLESLNSRGQYNIRAPVQTHIYNQNSQNVQRQKSTFNTEFQAPSRASFESFDQDYFGNFNSQRNPQSLVDQAKFSTIASPFPPAPTTTIKPKKLKPHQPPLAIFMVQEARKGSQVKVGDVLSTLKNADTIAVLDSVNPQSAPRVFIGPSTLNPPETFAKFELPYLSNIDHSDKKLRSLPFFVAPLSYKTPQGFAKIPFPSPHVGSVIINAQIKDSVQTPVPPVAPPVADVFPNSYSSPDPKPAAQPIAPVTQKPSVTFYTAAPPKTNAPSLQNNYYTLEPQTVSTLRTSPKEPLASIETPQRNSYFLSNSPAGNHQPHITNHVRFEPEDTLKTRTPGPIKAFNIETQTLPTTQRTTVSSTTRKPSTYPSQLLETHNPYSINQAFHFSTPLDYHTLYEENYATPGPHDLRGTGAPTHTIKTTTTTTAKPTVTVTHKQSYQTPNYAQNYSPEIHYESEVQNSRYQLTNSNEYTTRPNVATDYKTNDYKATDYRTTDYRETLNTPEYQQPLNAPYPTEYIDVETHTNIKEIVDSVNKALLSSEEPETSSKSPYQYNQYETSYDSEKQTSPSTTSTTTTTTTRRIPVRGRGRPRSTTTPRSDSSDASTKPTPTRRPLRERRPIPSRPKYEPNKITTERVTRKPTDGVDSTTKYNRGRTRGRITYKHDSDNEEYGGKLHKPSSKENDLAYQRDVLHQNYPVTLMERSSTVDIEAITEPVPRISSTKSQESGTEVYDTANADSNDNRAISQQLPNADKEEETSRFEPQTESSYTPGVSSTRGDFTFQSRSSFAPVDAISYDDENEDIYVRPTAPARTERPVGVSYTTQSISAATEEILPSYSVSNDYATERQEEATTVEVETKQETISQSDEPEENIVQTTPSYNRIRVRPGVVRQHYTTTETSRKVTKRPIQAVTYRPAFNNRRTTMRIEEIEADLKTKQVHARPEVQEHRHPVYRPEPTTESVSTGSQDTTTKRGVFRRRRPTYTTTTSATDTASKKTTYDVKSRFRGRRPTEKPSERPETQTEEPTATSSTRTTYNRYNSRSRLSDRYNKKPEIDEDDQESHYSVHRPKYAEAETDQWSPKDTGDSFKPYNPNDIVDDQKVATTERRSDEDETSIITARNDYYDMLISVTPATNNRGTKKIPDIPPTLEALVEQSKYTQNETAEGMSTFETMLEEVMKSLEEQDQDEYSNTVMKHKGGEIGEIEPERIISRGDNYKSTTVELQDTTTAQPSQDETTRHEEDKGHHRRGFWKKVKVRPITETIETAESQHYQNAANQLSHTITLTKVVHDKNGKYEKPKVTTYKPTQELLNNMFDSEDVDVLPTVDIAKINKPDNLSKAVEEFLKESTFDSTEKTVHPGDMDLGTGTPDPTLLDSMFITTTEPTDLADSNSEKAFSLMDYLFGATSEDSENNYNDSKVATKSDEKDNVEIAMESLKPKLATTENTFIPDELTNTTEDDSRTEPVTEVEVKKLDRVKDVTDKPVETSSVSSFMDPKSVVSTSMSTEVSHETEICFKGKCIKTTDINL